MTLDQQRIMRTGEATPHGRRRVGVAAGPSAPKGTLLPMTPQLVWHRDPSGRHQERAATPEGWTAHVRDDDNENVDPVNDIRPAPVMHHGVAPTARTVLWTDARRDLQSSATNGRFTTQRYVLTDDAIRISTGSIANRELVIPLWAVTGVTASQGLVQRGRGVHTLTISIAPSLPAPANSQGPPQILDIGHGQQVRDLIAGQANAVRAAATGVAHGRNLDVATAGASAHQVNVVNVPQQPSSGPLPGPLRLDASGSPAELEPGAPLVAATEESVFGALERLGALRDQGILTDDEFTAKKTELLRRL